MNKGILAGIIVIIAIVAVVGGYYGYGVYQSNTYNDLLLKTEGENGTLFQTGKILNETNFTTKSYETNIGNVKQAINLTDLTINQTQDMVNIAPDNTTKEYAQLRLKQYKDLRNIEEMYLKLYEDIQASGIFGAIGTISAMTNETNRLTDEMTADQNSIISLVNSNPQLKNRLNQTLGENQTKKLLEPAFKTTSN
nr:hypothetical protein [uncultured Methanobacterium sp.]